MKTWFGWLIALLQAARNAIRHRVPLPPDTPTPLLPPPSPQKTKKQATTARFKKDLLDELGLYFKYLQRVKNVDKEAYELHSEFGAYIGAYIVSAEDPDSPFIETKLDPIWRLIRPGFGAISFCASSERNEASNKGILFPRFMYFRKMALTAPMIEKVNIGDSYYCGAYFESNDKHKKKCSGAIDFPVVISPENEIRPLRVLSTETIPINRHSRMVRSNRSNRRSSTTIRHWVIPRSLREWARENKQEPEEFLASTFCLVANSFVTLGMQQMIKVTAKKNHLTAAFSIDVEKTPDFFADREPVVIAGTTKRIFHIVRPHSRVTGSSVKLHFRGVREFNWNGYAIRISVPGRDHSNVVECDVAALDEEMAKLTNATKDTINNKKFISILKQAGVN